MHPNFSAMWQEHERYIHWLAHRFGRYLRVDPDDLIGTLAIHMDNCLYSYEESMGPIASYIRKFALYYIRYSFLRYESDRENVRYWALTSDHKEERASIRVGWAHDNTPDYDYDYSHVYQDILDAFDTQEELRHFLLGDLDWKKKSILMAIYFLEKPLTDIAEEWGVSKQRIDQLRIKALFHVRDKMADYAKFSHLFPNGISRTRHKDRKFRLRELRRQKTEIVVV